MIGGNDIIAPLISVLVSVLIFRLIPSLVIDLLICGIDGLRPIIIISSRPTILGQCRRYASRRIRRMMVKARPASGERKSRKA